MPSRAQFAMIHMAKKSLAMPDEHYRAALGRYGVASSRDLTEKQADQLIDFFVELGWRPVSNGSRARPATGETPARPVDERTKYRRKIYALLRDMGLLGEKDDPFAYANGMAKNMFFRNQENVTIRIEHCDEGQLRKIVQALTIHRKRSATQPGNQGVS